MNAQATHVRTKASAQTERTDSTAAALQDLVEHNVKQVRVSVVYYMCTYEQIQCIFLQIL